MPDCYFHVGTHKTGSSAIQRFLGDRRTALLESGILAPKSGAAASGTHLPLCFALCGRPTSPALGDIAVLLGQELRAFPDHSVIVSAEGLERHFKEDAPSPIVDFFRQRGYRPIILAYFRDQTRRLNSSYSQVTKSFRTNEEFEDYVARYVLGGALLYSRWFKIAAAHRADLVARPFTQAVKSAGVVGDFLRVLGLHESLRASGDFRINEMVSAVAIAAARTAMDRLAEREVRLDDRQTAQARAALLSRDPGGPSFWGMTRQFSDIVYRHFDGDNETFARRAWGAEWREIFRADSAEELTSTMIDRSDESSPGHAEYLRLLDAVWPEIEGIARTPGPHRPRQGSQNNHDATGLGRFLFGPPSFP